MLKYTINFSQAFGKYENCDEGHFYLTGIPKGMIDLSVNPEGYCKAFSSEEIVRGLTGWSQFCRN